MILYAGFLPGYINLLCRISIISTLYLFIYNWILHKFLHIQNIKRDNKIPCNGRFFLLLSFSISMEHTCTLNITFIWLFDAVLNNLHGYMYKFLMLGINILLLTLYLLIYNWKLYINSYTYKTSVVKSPYLLFTVNNMISQTMIVQ